MRLPALAMLAILLAGCGSTSAPQTLSASGLAATPLGAQLKAPVLQVGDWWNFTTPAGALSYVVSAETPDDYTFDTDSRALAFFNAQHDVSTLGAIRKTDLAGSQGAGRVEFFHWPLVDGLNWTTTWDDVQVGIKAKDLHGGRFSFAATRPDGTPFASYSYDNKTRWFTELSFLDSTGAPGFTLKLQASGATFPGTLIRFDIKKIVAGNGTGPLGQNGNLDPSPYTDLYVQYSLACSSGAYSVAVGPLGGNPAVPGPGYLANGQCNPAVADTAFITVPPGAANWGYAIDGFAPDLVYNYQLLGLKATTFNAGKAP